MKKNIILSELCTLPLLVNGKVAIIEEGGYELLNPARYTNIEDNFNPLDYSILIHDVYARCIVYSTSKEKEQYLVNKQLRK